MAVKTRIADFPAVDPYEPMLDVKEGCHALNASRQAFLRLAKSGEIQCVKLPHLGLRVSRNRVCRVGRQPQRGELTRRCVTKLLCTSYTDSRHAEG